jgi:hypothetical protein
MPPAAFPRPSPAARFAFVPRAGTFTVEDIGEALSRLVCAVPAASTCSPPPAISVACIRLAAAHRSALRASRPELWREVERFYRQHLRPKIAPAEARHWDGALRIVE